MILILCQLVTKHVIQVLLFCITVLRILCITLLERMKVKNAGLLCFAATVYWVWGTAIS